MNRLLGIAAVVLLAATASSAAPVIGPWNNATPNQGDGPITGADTNSPVVGDGSSNSAESEMIDSPFPAVTLALPGDRVTLSGTVTLTGTVNSPVSSGTPRTQFRFGLFSGDDVGEDTGWVGYYMSNAHGTGTPAGTLARKPVGNTSTYLSATGQTSPVLASTQGNDTPFNDDTYTFNVTIERVGDALLVTGTLTGTATTGFSQSLSGTDTTASTLGTYTFDHVGFLMGGNLDADQASFSNVEVTFVPEPGAAALVAVIALLVLRRQRHA